jgi:hypothetical protein
MPPIKYHLQLVSSLHNKRVLGRFQNIQRIDLHLAFHSVLTELASARDYLAAIGGRHAGAPPSVDVLNRLVSWIKKPAGRMAPAEPLVAALLEASDEALADPWLRDITDYRNMFLHSEPMTNNEHARWLALVERETPYGKARLIEMQIPFRAGLPNTCEALCRFVELHARMCRLADFAARHAKYAPIVPHVEIVD